MKPIPKKLLIHSAAAITETVTDMWGNQTESGSVDLTSVRVEPSSALKLDKLNQQIQLDAVLFYDCRNSRPLNHEFSHDEKIEYSGADYRIVSVKKMYDGEKLHHIEVGLCL